MPNARIRTPVWEPTQARTGRCAGDDVQRDARCSPAVLQRARCTQPLCGAGGRQRPGRGVRFGPRLLRGQSAAGSRAPRSGASQRGQVIAVGGSTSDSAGANCFRWQNNSIATVGFDWTSRVIHSSVLQNISTPFSVPFSFPFFFFNYY